MTGDSHGLPVLLDRDGSFVTTRLELLGMAYANRNAWYGRPDLFLDGNPLVSGETAGSGTSGWLEGFMHAGIHGITPVDETTWARPLLRVAQPLRAGDPAAAEPQGPVVALRALTCGVRNVLAPTTPDPVCAMEPKVPIDDQMLQHLRDHGAGAIVRLDAYGARIAGDSATTWALAGLSPLLAGAAFGTAPGVAVGLMLVNVVVMQIDDAIRTWRMGGSGPDTTRDAFHDACTWELATRLSRGETTLGRKGLPRNVASADRVQVVLGGVLLVALLGFTVSLLFFPGAGLAADAHPSILLGSAPNLLLLFTHLLPRPHASVAERRAHQTARDTALADDVQYAFGWIMGLMTVLATLWARDASSATAEIIAFGAGAALVGKALLHLVRWRRRVLAGRWLREWLVHGSGKPA